VILPNYIYYIVLFYDLHSSKVFFQIILKFFQIAWLNLNQIFNKIFNMFFVKNEYGLFKLKSDLLPNSMDLSQKAKFFQQYFGKRF